MVASRCYQNTNEPCVGHEATDVAFANGCHNAVARSTWSLRHVVGPQPYAMIKRILRFRLRFLLFAVVFCALLFTYASYLYRSEQRELAAVDSLLASGASENITYTLDSTIPFSSLRYMIRKTGLREPFCVRTLVLRTSAFSDSDIGDILTLTHLTKLAIVDGGFTDKGISRISTLDSLEIFKVHRSNTQDHERIADVDNPFGDSLFGNAWDTDLFGDSFSPDDDPFASSSSIVGN